MDAILAATTGGKIVAQSVLSSAVMTERGSAPLTYPTGFGVYVRRVTADEAVARQVAHRCRVSGICWAMLMVESSDGYIVPEAARQVYAQAFRDEGLTVGVWSLPGEARAASTHQSWAAAETLTAAAAKLDSKLVLLDIERSYKGRSEELHALVDGTIDTAPEGSSIGAASYPVPSYHSTLDWSAFRSLDYGSPMLYESAQDPDLIAQSFLQWSSYVPVILPSLDGWTGSGAAGASRFEGDVLRVCGTGPARTPGAIVWSEAQMDDAKRAVTKKMQDRYGWPTAV